MRPAFIISRAFRRISGLKLVAEGLACMYALKASFIVVWAVAAILQVSSSRIRSDLNSFIVGWFLELICMMFHSCHEEMGFVPFQSLPHLSKMNFLLQVERLCKNSKKFGMRSVLADEK